MQKPKELHNFSAQKHTSTTYTQSILFTFLHKNKLIFNNFNIFT